MVSWPNITPRSRAPIAIAVNVRMELVPAPAITAGSLTIDPARRLARIDGRDVELTAHEFDLLYLLATNRGIVFSRESLMQRVWGDDLHVTERSVDSLVKRLRKKIEADQANPRYVLTVWGAGYKFAERN